MRQESRGGGQWQLCRSTRSCQIPIALRPRDSSSSINSRYASLAPDGRLPPCSGNRTSGKKPVITSLAGFESSAGLDGEKPVITSLAGFEVPEPVGAEG